MAIREREVEVLEFRSQDRRLREHPRNRMAALGAGAIPRRFCTGTALVSDGYKRRVEFSVRDGLGFLGTGWGTDWCCHWPRSQLRLRAAVQAGGSLIVSAVGCRRRSSALSSFRADAQPMRDMHGAPAGTFDFYVLALSWSPVSAKSARRRAPTSNARMGVDLAS